MKPMNDNCIGKNYDRRRAIINEEIKKSGKKEPNDTTHNQNTTGQQRSNRNDTSGANGECLVVRCIETDGASIDTGPPVHINATL